LGHGVQYGKKLYVSLKLTGRLRPKLRYFNLLWIC